ncbi:MAG TPA: PAS domain S-box protein [Pyrinomonadaceae bacterium]|jgi:PAS domain S-box-containing protein
MTKDNEQGKASKNQSEKRGIKTTLSDEIAPYWLAAIIDSADDAIISKTLEGIITSWNKGAERIFGYKAEEVIGKPILILIPPDHYNEEPAILERIKNGERIEHYETVRITKGGKLIDISLTISPIKNANGKIIGASKIAREITDIKRTKQELEASDERYRTLFNSIDEGFCIIEVLFNQAGEPVDYRFLEINPAFEKLTGIPADEALRGTPISQLVPNFEERWYQLYGKVATTGEPVRAVEGSQAMGRWFDVNAFRVGGQESRKVAVLFNNITDRKQAEQDRERLLEQLEAERSKLAYLFTKAPAFVATLKGPEHIFELTNPAYLQLIGHRDVIGKPVREALPEIEGQGFFEILDNVFQTGEPFIGRELSVQLQWEPDAPLENRFVDFVYQPILEANGSVSGIFAHGFDITEQVQARRDAEQANRAKDEFLATLSHELRTPLNAILGWSTMLSDTKTDEEIRVRAVETIRRNARIQSQLIDDILDVSRIISGKLKLETQPLELSSVIEAAVESVLPAAQAKEIRLQRVLDSGSSMISGDRNRLQQIVWNLLSNAVKFTPKGGRVQIRLERINSHIEIIVSDTGIGISPKVMPFIFERFRQADSATTRQHGGLGLGLAIVRHLVEMHGGTVEVESGGEGSGSTFTVKLPLISLRSVEVSPEESKEREHPTSNRDVPFECTPELEGLHVLVVDDEGDGRRLVRAVLEKCGAKVTAADSAAAALNLIQELRPDILLSDLGMPGEDGYSLIKKVRALSAEQGGTIPAAALTAYARVEDRMKVLRAGFQIHLPKPVEPAELVAVVANLSGRHHR